MPVANRFPFWVCRRRRRAVNSRRSRRRVRARARANFMSPGKFTVRETRSGALNSRLADFRAAEA